MSGGRNAWNWSRERELPIWANGYSEDTSLCPANLLVGIAPLKNQYNAPIVGHRHGGIVGVEDILRSFHGRGPGLTGII
jgi:hypothetical protein